MRKQLFSSWLMKELTSSRMALLSILTQKDELLYQKAPQLRREYMDKIGRFEQEVLDVELECYLLRRKKEAIQTAINQRISVDIDKINDMLEAEKNKLLNKWKTGTLHLRPFRSLPLKKKTK